MSKSERLKPKEEIAEDLHQAAINDYKAKERERIAIQRLRSIKEKSDVTAAKKRKASSLSSVAGLQKIILQHNIQMKAIREKRRSDIDTKELNDRLRANANVKELTTHIRNKMVALSYGCLDIRTFYRRLFSSFDHEHDDKLDVDEIGFMLRKYCTVKDQDVRTAVALMDADDNGDIDFDEFFNFLDIKTSKASNIKARDVPISPRSKIDWCLAHVHKQEDLTFAIHMLRGLADKQPPLVLLRKGAVQVLWDIVLDYTVQNAKADRVLEGEEEAITAARALGADASLEDMHRRNRLVSVHTLREELETVDEGKEGGQPFPVIDQDIPQITLDQRDTAIEVLEILSNSFAVLSRKMKDVPLPDPEALVFELHVRSVHIAKNHVKGVQEDDEFSDSEEEEEEEGQTLEEKLAKMQAKVEATRKRVQEEKDRREAEDAEAEAGDDRGARKQAIIEQLIDAKEILFLMRCIFVQINSLDQMRLLELLECVLLIIGEGRHHEVLGLTRPHRRVAQSILSKFQSKQVDALLKALKKSGNHDYVHRVIMHTGKKVLQGIKQHDAEVAKWDNKKKEENKRLKKLAIDKKRKIQILEKIRRKTLSEEASKSEKRKEKREKERLKLESKQLEEEENRRQRATDMKRRMRAEQRHQKKMSKLKHLKRQKEEMRMEEERERKNQEAMREWRRAKAQKAREQESRRREDKRRRKAKRKQKYVRFVRLPSISLKGAAPPEPHFARETFAGATASYGAGAGAARDDRRPLYPTPAQVRANAAEALLAVGRQQRRRFKDPYVRRKHSKKR